MLFVCILLLATSCLARSLQNDTIQQDSSNEELFEGDLLLTKDEIRALTGAGGARGLKKNHNWPGGIVYYTIDTRNPIKKAIIRSAIREWEEFTCIRFKERTTQEDYIEFFAGKGCYSNSVGKKSRGGKQQISLGFACITHGIAVHEIGHALGMYHEQSRPDRDQYVEIIWDNIQEGHTHNFRKYEHGTSIDSLGSPYDYDSIMHYGKRDFAWPPWKTTIKTKNGAKIGQRKHLSKLDRQQMNMLYNCYKK